VLESPPGMTVGGLGLCQDGLQKGAIVGRQVAKSHSPVAIVMGERTGMDWARV
jgi:hypothetical protein